MIYEGPDVLTAFFADDEGAGSWALAALRPPGRPRLSGSARGNARATIRAIAAPALRQVDKHTPGDGATSPHFTEILLQAAIAAAKSDRRLAPSDLADIAAQVPNLGLSGDATAFLGAEILRPEMMDHLTRRLATRDEMVEVYVASRLAADAGSSAADHYLKMLSARLGLEQALTDAVEAIVAEG